MSIWKEIDAKLTEHQNAVEALRVHVKHLFDRKAKVEADSVGNWKVTFNWLGHTETVRARSAAEATALLEVLAVKLVKKPAVAT